MAERRFPTNQFKDRMAIRDRRPALHDRPSSSMSSPAKAAPSEAHQGAQHSPTRRGARDRDLSAPGEKFDRMHTSPRARWAYLYSPRTRSFSMDNETYEQISSQPLMAESALQWVAENIGGSTLLSLNGETLREWRPAKLRRRSQISRASDPGVRGDTAQGHTKRRRLEGRGRRAGAALIRGGRAHQGRHAHRGVSGRVLAPGRRPPCEPARSTSPTRH